MSTKNESGLSRWARRKAAVRDNAASKPGAALPAAAPVADAPPQPQADDAARSVRGSDAPDRQAEEIPGHLPDIESLDYNSDYAGFLSEDVSDAVRNIALRKLWRSNPLLANVDGLVDYGDDFTDAATVVEGMKTAYRVGRGMIKDEPEGTEEALASTESASDEPQDEDRGPAASDSDTDDAAAQQEPETQIAEAEPQADADAKRTDADSGASS